MKSERWRRIDDLLHEALRHPSEDRDTFLTAACAGDEALRREVESLLAASAQAGDFIERGALEAEARSIVDDEIESMVGRRVEHYEIESLLGVGGMGQVYLARDERLNRRIAIKLMPASYTLDEMRVQRFEREARAASALNHANILTVYEVGQVDGRPYIATEFIEGETLRERLKRGPIAFAEALEIAVQAASALMAAHAAGIVHRDIKPENIMVRPDGLVKVLDFGIAKLGEELSAGNAAAPPSGGELRTGSGILGTVQYMSPEQARGQEVDARTDLFSLGGVLYEMLAGESPFSAAQPAEVMTAILEKEPKALRSIAPGVPSDFARIVEKALRKDRADRYQKAEDLLGDLKELKRRTDLAALPGRRLRRFLLAAGVLLLAGVGIWVGLRLWRNANQTASFGAMRFTPLTNNGKAASAAISPDGKYVAYAATSADGPGLWLRRMDAGSHELLLRGSTSRTSYSSLVFSPAGDALYYRVSEVKDQRPRELFRKDIAGGEPVKVIDGVDSRISFFPDGRRFVFIRLGKEMEALGLITANIDGSGEREIAMPREFVRDCIDGALSPDGKTIVCTMVSAPGRYWMLEINVETGKSQPFSTEKWEYIGPPVWLPDGSGLIADAENAGTLGQQLWRIAYPQGEARRITNDLNNYQNASLTADARALVATQITKEDSIWLIPDGDTSRARQVTFSQDAGLSGITWTPDGRIIYMVSDGDGRSFWIIHPDGSGNRQLTGGEGNKTRPSVTRDGRYLIYDMGNGIWRLDLAGGETRQLSSGSRPDCTPDGKWVVYIALNAGKPALWKISIEGGDPVHLFDLTDKVPFAGKVLAVSPDGTMIAYVYSVDQTVGGAVKVVSSANGRVIKTFDQIHTGHGIQWSPDGKAIIYTNSREVRNVWSQPLAGGAPRQLTHFKDEGVYNCSLSLDGKQLACRRRKTISDAIMISDFQ